MGEPARDFDAADDPRRRQRLCPAGVVANEYLAKAANPRERRRRQRRLLALGAKKWWAMPDSDVAQALNVHADTVGRLANEGRQEIRDLAFEMDILDDRIERADDER